MDEFPEGLIELVAMLPYVIVKVIKVKITGAIREHRYNKLMDLRLARSGKRRRQSVLGLI